MRKTLLLVFVHGFKGGDDTFGTFPEHLRALLSHALPRIDVLAVQYPKFETRGELKDCVERFREWLQNRVIDIEVAHSTPSPTVDPSVHTVLIGHSMGGIVAAETVLLLVNDQLLPASPPSTTTSSSPSSKKTTNSNFPSNTTFNSTPSTNRPTSNQPQSPTTKSTTSSPPSRPNTPSSNKPPSTTSSPKVRPSTPSFNHKPSTASSPKTRPSTPSSNHKPSTDTNSPKPSPSATPMFPQIIGLLAFDTPFLGISPGVIAHGAEGHYKTASSAYNVLSELSSAFGWSGAASSPKSPSGTKSPKNSAPIKSPSQPAGLITNGGDAAATPRWQSWGKYAMFAGAAGAVAAGGAAALYSQREKLTSGWGWIGGHLEFVGCLLRGEELKLRVERLGALSSSQNQNQNQHPVQLQNQEKRKSTGDPRSGGREKGSGSKNGFKGSANFYTLLGRGATNTDSAEHIGTKILVDGILEKRTFCKLPPAKLEKKKQEQASQKSIGGPVAGEQTGDGGGGGALQWIPAVNEKASDEILAHTSMFYPRDNPGFYALGEKSKEIVAGWVLEDGGKGWYESSEESTSGAGTGFGGGPGTSKVGGKGKGAGSRRKAAEESSEHVWVHSKDAEDDGDGDVKMRDGSVDAEDLEGSVLVDKAS
ncbi:hypothetical protein GJ744_006854 [Endocarpon pusillum]|uniref:AB hydrolase-1 domain-containing protein n=1 Tax=Endocarpon pusillum TaxID=364733 RepID=A0A8H7E6T9_9EURO|nr:hypothetical protein GJ744_006854 [Endocarpon pusillum]